MKPYLRLLAGLSALVLAPLGAALATPMQCITQPKMCNPDLLCLFKLDLEEKNLMYELLLANSPNAKKKGWRQGVPYKGDLYQQALDAASRSDSTLEGEDLAQAAYNQLAGKLGAKADAAARNAECTELGLKPKPELSASWNGMQTNRHDCFTYVTFPGSSDLVTPDSAKDKATGCQELWDADIGHEDVHKQECNTRARATDKPPTTFGSIIEEDIAAYRYSLVAARESLITMQLRCTHEKNTDAFRKKADELLKKLKPYRLPEGPKR